MPATRTSSRKAPTSRRRKISVINSDPKNNSAADAEANEVSDSDQESLIQIQLKAFMRNVRKLEHNLKESRKSNLQLQQELDAFRDGVPVTPRKRAASTNVETVIRVQNLEGRIKELEKKNMHLHRRLKKLQAKELEMEADELREALGEGQLAEQDDVHKMRKLLHDFQEWMAVTTLAEDEDCPICFERLKPKKTYGLPCQHLVCDECLPQISRGSDETVKCPQCRDAHPREEVEVLAFTETERFDGLLGLAAQWALIDHSGGESNEEEAEEGFIDDGETRSESSDRDTNNVPHGGGGVIEGEDEKGSEASTSVLSTPEPACTASYAESPTREKRKKMEELAQSRSQRRRVL